MRWIIISGLLAVGAAISSAPPAHAVGARYPFCLQGNEFPGLSNCTFTSYQQCQATASGRYLTCIENPYFAGTGEPRAGRGRARSYPSERY